jgi:adenosylhomocysteine nucleosidase
MVLIVTPLPVERAALRSATASTLVRSDFEFRVGGHGKAQFALGVYRAVCELRPSLVVCAGACGALAPSLAVGNVVVASETIEHDFRVKFGAVKPPRFAGDAAAVAKLGTVDGVHVGLIASGDEDVIDSARAAELASSTGALAVAWEGAGGARACLMAGVPFVEVRAVVDTCGPSASRDFSTHLNLAMSELARVLAALT